MYDFKNKQENIAQNNNYILAKTSSMFEYGGLPGTIPYRELERALQTKGYCFITEVEGDLYVFTGGLGGVPDVYGQPTEIIIANPALKLNKTFNLETDGVFIRSDDAQMGLIPLLNKYNYMLVENDISMILHGYNSRVQSMISASDDKTKASAELYLENLINGELGVVGESALFDGVKSHNSGGSNSASVTQLIEFHQYTKASLFNELGLGANFNMKRERLTSGEVDQGDDILYPFIDNMMKCRIKGIEALNAKYSLDVVLDYGSVWNRKNKELVDDIIDASGGDISNDPLNESTDGTTDEPLNESSLQQSLKLYDILQIENELMRDDLDDVERAEWVELLDELKGDKKDE